MAWPTATDYDAAIQHPSRHFCTPELKRGHAALDESGKPRVRSTKRVQVFELRSAGSQGGWALGCFTQKPKGLARRYQLINEHLQLRPLPSLVETAYHAQGIAIRGRFYPITLSRWVEGQALKAHIRAYLDNPDELRLLAEIWLQLARGLQEAGIAHGNLTGDTVLVATPPGGSLALQLLDYDAVFVPELAGNPPEEMGHADFQHPDRCWQHVYNADVDRFSQLVVLTALHALAAEGRSLWDRFDIGDNLLFRHEDFKEPAHSALLRQLWQSENRIVRGLAGRLILACHGSVAEVPALELAAVCLRRGGGPLLASQKAAEVDQIMDTAGGRRKISLEIDDARQVSAGAADDFNLVVDDESLSLETAVAVVQPIACQGTPALPRMVPPPLPAAVADHPFTQTFQFDAWMPQQVAVLKLQGFVKDIRGEIVRNVPGHIVVHLLDEQEVAQPAMPGILSWLGFVEQSPPVPQVLAVMELNLIHKPSPTRPLIGITVRLTPGPDDEVAQARWKLYCERIFCELRGYMIGSL